MPSKLNIFVIATYILALSGCATQATVNINSQPIGAYITVVGTTTSLGISPTAAYYDASVLRQNKNSDGCYHVRGYKAQWVSGATKTVNPIRLCHGATNSYNWVITRNNNDAGLDKDLAFALQVQNTLAQQRQAKASQNAAFAQMWSAYSLSQGAKSTTNCTTTAVGGSLKTSYR